MEPEVKAALAGIPLLSDATEVRATPLSGGNTNRVWRIDSDKGRFVLRLSQADSPDERHNMATAAAGGLSPPILYMDRHTLLTPFLNGVLNVKSFRDPAVVEAAGHLLGRLHSGPAFQGESDPFAVFDIHRSFFSVGDFPEIPELQALLEWTARLRAALSATRPPLAPCHNDPMPSNIIATGDRMVMIDWQTAAMGDPDQDLGILSSYVALPPDQLRRFLAAALGCPEGPRADRVILYHGVAAATELAKMLGMVRRSNGESGWWEQAHHAVRIAKGLSTDPTLLAALTRVLG